MDLLDVNVLVNAYRRDAPEHEEFAKYVATLIMGAQPYAIPSVVLSGFFRIATHPRVFSPPSKFNDALVFAEQLRSQPHCVVVTPGARHWEIFVRLCQSGDARGNLVSDAYLAAIAVQNVSELVRNHLLIRLWVR